MTTEKKVDLPTGTAKPIKDLVMKVFVGNAHFDGIIKIPPNMEQVLIGITSVYCNGTDNSPLTFAVNRRKGEIVILQYHLITKVLEPAFGTAHINYWG